MSAKLSEQEQLVIIKEVEEKYSKFLDPNFDASIFLKCRDNFALTEHIESIKIFEMDNTPINPTFTIAIPTYNRCKTLKEAIDSVLNQDTDEIYEIIVVENVDNFDTKTPAQEMLEKEYKGKLTYYKNKSNIGLIANWNRCLELANGKWTSILHSDDKISPNYISSMASLLPEKENYIAIASQAEFTGYKKHIFSEETNLWQKIKKKALSLRTFDEQHSLGEIKNIQISACLFNTKKSRAIGGFGLIDYPMPDPLFFTRAYRNGSILLYQKKLVEKNTDIATSSNPKTALECCFLLYALRKVINPIDIGFWFIGCQKSIKEQKTIWNYSRQFNQYFYIPKCQMLSYLIKIKIKRACFILGLLK